jgi:hypothetical protein
MRRCERRGARLARGAVVWVALGALPVGAWAAPTVCPSDAGIYTCVVQDGDSTLAVMATSLNGGWVYASMSRGAAEVLPIEGFRIWSFDDSSFLDVVLESATQDPVTRQIRIQFLEANDNAVRAVGTTTLSEQGDATVIDEGISVQNLLPFAVAGRLYVVTDFDLASDALDDSIAVSQSGTRIEQQHGTASALLEVTGDPPTSWDVAACCSLSDILSGYGLVTLLDRTGVPGPADFQAAWAWDRQIGIGQTVAIAVRKTYVPEPSATALGGMAAVALAALAVGRRSRARRADSSRAMPVRRRSRRGLPAAALREVRRG